MTELKNIHMESKDFKGVRATIEDWYPSVDTEGQIRIHGKVKGDVRKEFKDGEEIKTTRILVLDIEWARAKTKNSLYKLGRRLGE